MADSFLDIIGRMRGDGDDGGDEFGGGTGQDGSGLPRGAVGDSFMFATGIECSNPTIEHGRVRRDQLAECGHYERWREDLRLVRALGLKVLRYGLPIHKVWLGRDRYDWSFADDVMAEMKRLTITPILDLIHFGVPDWLGDFQNPELPVLFRDYCAAVAERYPWVRYYTPVNEAYVTARNSAKLGFWNEQLKSDRAFITALKHLVACSILGCHAIAERRHDAVIVQSESAEYLHEDARQPRPPRPAGQQDQVPVAGSALRPSARRRTDPLGHGQRLDSPGIRLVHARRPAGIPRCSASTITGATSTSSSRTAAAFEAEDVMGWRAIAADYWRRYRKPLMHTETNVFDAGAAPVLAVETVGERAFHPRGRRAGAGLHLVLADRPGRLGQPALEEGGNGERLRPLRPRSKASRRRRRLPPDARGVRPHHPDAPCGNAATPPTAPPI